MKKFMLIGMLFATPVGAADMKCGEVTGMRNALEREYGEEPAVRGLDGNGAMIEIWGNTATGSWTFMVTSPAGMTCIIGTGLYFERVAGKANL